MDEKRNIVDGRAEVLFDLLASGDLTSAQITAQTGWNYHQFMKAVQRLRDILAANGDVISVPAEPQGTREPWLYGLKAGQVIVDPEQSQWVVNRFQDAERRLMTINHVLQVAATSLDGRTIEGRKARIYHLHISRAREEVAMLSGENGQ